MRLRGAESDSRDEIRLNGRRRRASQPGYGGLVFDKNGNLYGTTDIGGGNGCNGNGCGTVFKISKSNGIVTESVLYSFTGGADGEEPLTGLTSDALGNFYGTTTGGGMAGGNGTVFRQATCRSGC